MLLLTVGFSPEIPQKNIASTCIQNGIAIPHCRTTAVSELTIAVGIKKDGYCFDSMDGQKTQIFILCLSPANANAPHIECLAAAASLLNRKDNTKKILSATAVNEVYDIFRA